MSPRRPFSDISDSSALRLAQSLRAQAPARHDLAQSPRARAVFLLFLGFVLPILVAARFIRVSQSDITRRPEMNLKAMAVVAGGAVASIASADAVQWRVEAGGNGHWYAIHVFDGVTPWTIARDAAQARSGHLATLTSAAEDNFVRTMVVARPEVWSVGDIVGPWIGAFSTAECGSCYSWVTGETFQYSRWHPGEPNCSCPNGVAFWERNGSQAWQDMTPDYDGHFQDGGVQSAVIEWSADCNNDGIVDYGQCRDGSLPDFNGNNIPDCCDAGTPCAVGNYPVQWRVQDGGNGHWYLVAAPYPNLTWQQASQLASAMGGHPVTFGSSAETSRVVALVQASPAVLCPLGPWIGLVQDLSSPSYSEPAGGWRWVDGSSAAINWQAPLNPNNDCFGVAENNANMTFEGQINDLAADPACIGYWPNGAINSVVIEWSADCNTDGVVDYGQILDGSLSDANGNFIPDACEFGGCAGDVTGDSAVNGDDLAIVLSSWGSAPPKGGGVGPGDVNGDGTVDGADLAVVLGSWGPCN